MEKKHTNQQVAIALNFCLPFRDFHLVSQDYIINKSVIENWTLGKLKIPEFASVNEMEDWIIAVDFLIKSERFIVSGPEFPYYTASSDFYTKQLTIEDINGNVYQIPERNYYNKNAQPLNLLDTKKLTDYFNKSYDVFLAIDSYGPCSANEKTDGKYSFKEIYMCGLVDFLLNVEKATFLPPKEQVMFGSAIENFSFEDDFDETDAFWAFKNIKDNNQVFVIEFKYQEAKKMEQLDYFNSWVMWHEKFIHNNIMYFVLFQTDEIDNENMIEHFSHLKKTISKRYGIKSYILERKSYLELKTSLRHSELNEQ